MNKKAEINWDVVFIILVVIFAVSMIFFLQIVPDKQCKDAGYEHADSSRLSYRFEKGYMSCCNYIYVDHVERNICETVKVK